ncbi:MAG: transporter substrate-binding domain-containing protein [Bacteroidales bacterium]|nr:transporter substrate-binding domain-containing protein [Bacteroidales bacterium]
MKRNILLLVIIIFFSACNQDSEKITRLFQLKDRSVAVITGTAADVAARKYFPDAEKQNFYATTDAAYNVKIGKSDAFIFDKVVLDNIIQKYPELTLIAEPVAKAEIAIAFNKERIVLLEKVNVALEQLQKQGTMEAMKARWIEPGYEQVPELPQKSATGKRYTTSPFSDYHKAHPSSMKKSGKGSVLRVGVCAQFEPMMFVSNNKITGFDMELLIRIADILGQDFEVVDMSFDSLILSLHSEKIDFAISNFDITEQRKKFVSFSEPYLTQDIVALVRK